MTHHTLHTVQSVCRVHSVAECGAVQGLDTLPPHQDTWLLILRAKLCQDPRLGLLQGSNTTTTTTTTTTTDHLAGSKVLSMLGIEPEEAVRLNSVLTSNTFRRGSGRCLCPAMAMVNHNCSPNCRVHWEEGGKLVLTAKKAIPAGEELTITYCSSLLGTPARQRKLAVSKGFWCACTRCLDPMEGGTMMGGLSCTKCGQGVLLPHIRQGGDITWLCPCGFQANTDKVIQGTWHTCSNTATLVIQVPGQAGV